MENKKENSLHKLFKLTIIVIVLIFIGLIYYFLKLQLSSSSDDFLDYIFEFNRDKYLYFNQEDKDFKYSKIEKEIEDCNFTSAIDFYKHYVIPSKPCVIKSSSVYTDDITSQFKLITELSKELSALTHSFVKSTNYIPMGNVTEALDVQNQVKEPFFAKYLKLNKKLYLSGTKDFESKNFMNQYNHLIMIIEGETVFRISPPSQISHLNPFRNISTQKDFWDFNTVYSKNNFFGLEEKYKRENEKVRMLSAKLQSKDVLFIPSFFFIQYRIMTDTMLSMMWDYQCNSRVLKTMFKVLFDDNVGEEDALDF